MDGNKLSSEEYAALMSAAKKLGYSLDDFECAMGFGWGAQADNHWKSVRIEMESEAERILADRGAAAEGGS